jgi:hypothetical protein
MLALLLMLMHMQWEPMPLAVHIDTTSMAKAIHSGKEPLY